MTVRLGSLCTFLGRVSDTLRTPPRPGLPSGERTAPPALPSTSLWKPRAHLPFPAAPPPGKTAQLLGPRPSSPQGGPTAAGWAGRRGERAGVSAADRVRHCRWAGQDLGPTRSGSLGNWGTEQLKEVRPGPGTKQELGGVALCGWQAQLDGTFLWAWSQRSDHIPCGWPPPLSCPDHGHVFAPCPQAGKQAHAVPALQPPPDSRERSPAPRPLPRWLRSPLAPPQATVAPSSQPSTLTQSFL